MRFDVADVLGLDARGSDRLRDHSCLAVDARSGEPDLGRAVVVDGRAPDYRLDPVSVGQGIGQAPEHHDTGSAPEHRSAAPNVKGAGVTVGRLDAAFLVKVPGALGNAHADAAGQGDVALSGQQTLAGQVDGHERGRTRRLHADARAAQVELVGNPRRQVVLVVAEQGLEPLERVGRLQALEDVRQEVMIESGPGEDADRAAVAVGRATCAFERFPHDLHEDPVLRVHPGGHGGAVSEEAGVEILGVLEETGGGHVAGIGRKRRIDA